MRKEDKMDSDFFLIQKMKNGDDGAIESFVRKYYPKIFQYCLLHIRDRGDAEDLTQETFLKFFQSFERYQHRGKCSAFLYAIASNACKDYYRKAKEQYVEEIPERQRKIGRWERQKSVWMWKMPWPGCRRN